MPSSHAVRRSSVTGPEVGFGMADLQGSETVRLFRARAVEHSLLIRGRDPLHPSEVDARVPVDPTR